MGIIESAGMAFNFVLDPMLKPLMKLGYFWAILIASVAIAGIMTLMYWWLTDQKRMKEIKETQKKLQKEIKAAGKTDPKKAMSMQPKILALGKEQMMRSFKPTLITIIPLIIIFAWLNTHMGFHPLMAGEEFNVTLEFDENVNGEVTIDAPSMDVNGDVTKKIKNGIVSWDLKAEDAGLYTIDYNFNSKTFSNEMAVRDNALDGYLQPVTPVKDEHLNKITTGLKKVIVFRLFGLNFSWFWSYILFSLVASMGLRKVFRIY